jgi:hypothetical protein
MQSTEENELSVKQQQFIAALIAGNPIVVAAKVVGIAEKTAYNWFKLPHFQEAYRSAKQIAFDHALDELRDGVNLAVSTLKRNMGETVDPAVQVRAAKIWLDSSLAIHQNNDLEQKHAEILEKLKEIGVKP